MAYPFTDEAIDVVIPAIEKDLFTLDYAVEGIKKNGDRVRRVIVVSKTPLTAQAEWFDESLFPFTKIEVSRMIFGEDNHPRAGWFFQQLLKFYASYVIPDISSNVLILDADAIFLRPVQFLNERQGGLYGFGKEENPAYFEHGRKLIPGFARLFPKYSGVTHHMLFQRPVLDDLFQTVETLHQIPFWQAFCKCVDASELSSASEYELYFNFVFARCDQVALRKLRYKDVAILDFDIFQKYQLDYVACHDWLRIRKRVSGRSGRRRGRE